MPAGFIPTEQMEFLKVSIFNTRDFRGYRPRAAARPERSRSKPRCRSDSLRPSKWNFSRFPFLIPAIFAGIVRAQPRVPSVCGANLDAGRIHSDRADGISQGFHF
jgi:hypothetical protein